MNGDFSIFGSASYAAFHLQCLGKRRKIVAASFETFDQRHLLAGAPSAVKAAQSAIVRPARSRQISVSFTGLPVSVSSARA